MKTLYLQMNILIATAWLLFWLVPKGVIPCRTQKWMAQVIFAASVVSIPVVSLLPDLFFPRIGHPTVSLSSREVDVAAGVSANSKPVPGPKTREPFPIVTENTPEIDPIALFLALGFLLTMLKGLRSAVRLRNFLADTIPLHRVGKTSVVVSHATSVPFSVLTWRRAFVVMPGHLVFHRQDWRIAIRHEIEHHRRRDTLWARVLEWCVYLFYLNPAVYLWRNMISDLQELACDEALIGRMGVSKQAYGSCLIRVAETALRERVMFAGTASMIPLFGSKSGAFLTRRISMFTQHERIRKRSQRSILIGTISCIAIVGGAFLAQAAVRESASTPNSGQPRFDGRIQAIAFESLERGLDRFGARAGFAIVADPVRGTILASAALNRGYDPKLKDDWALSYPVEPGSTLKPLIIASALEQKLTTASEMHDCENGEFGYGNNVYYDVDPATRLSTAATVVHSSNICTIKIAQLLGAKGLESMLRDFGIGRAGSAQDFPAARSGHVPEAGKIPDENFIALISHGVSNRTGFYVTPIELVQAYAAFANGGKLLRPVPPPTGTNLQTGVIRQVISPATAQEVRSILRKVVVDGTAQSIKGSRVPLAGKTSTVGSEGVARTTGFIGFAPVDHPKVLVYVMLIDVTGEKRTGSSTAAPVFREIVEKVLPTVN